MAAEYHEEDLEPMMPINPNPVRPKNNSGCCA